MLTFTSWPTRRCQKVEQCLINYLYKFVPKHICRNHIFNKVPDYDLKPPRPPLPPGHEPRAKSHGMKAESLKYPWFKYKCFLLSGWRDIVTMRNFNHKLWRIDLDFDLKPQPWPQVMAKKLTVLGTHGSNMDALCWVVGETLLQRETVPKNFDVTWWKGTNEWMNEQRKEMNIWMDKRKGKDIYPLA